MGWGVHDYPSPPEPKPFFCPRCRRECETLFTNENGEVIGCDNEITVWDRETWEDAHEP